MASQIRVRRARLSDAEAIAAFVNAAQTGASRGPAKTVNRLSVAQRFSQVGFMIAERDDQLIGLLGWQMENLVGRVTDFLVTALADPVEVGTALISMVEAEAHDLQAEVVLLFLPSNPSPKLVTFWGNFGYEFQDLEELRKAWREAVLERDRHAQSVMVKRLREDYIRQPI